MTRYSIDTDGVSRERLALAHDPAELRECASLVAAATAGAMSATGRRGRRAFESHSTRFRAVHAHALDAVADAASALGDRLDRSTLEARSVELFVTAGFAQVSASGLAAQGISAAGRLMSRVHEAGRAAAAIAGDGRAAAARGRRRRPARGSAVAGPGRRAGSLDPHRAGDAGREARRGLDRGRGDCGRRRGGRARETVPSRRRRPPRGRRAALLAYAAALDHAIARVRSLQRQWDALDAEHAADRPSPRRPPGPDRARSPCWGWSVPARTRRRAGLG